MNFVRKIFISFVVGRNYNKRRAFFLCHPYGFGGGNALRFRNFVFGKNNSSALFFTAAYRHGVTFEFGVIPARNRGEKVIKITVQNNSVQKNQPPNRTNVHMYYNTFAPACKQKFYGTPYLIPTINPSSFKLQTSPPITLPLYTRMCKNTFSGSFG